MTDREKQIIETFAVIVPLLSEIDKSYLLGLGEGMAIKVRGDIEVSKPTEGEQARAAVV